MKASELKRFQTYPRLGGHALSKKRTAVYARRWYWRRKLRAAGVPEIDLEDTLDRLQRRLVEVTGGESGRIYLATQAEIMGSGLEE
jgi:hypothetical protein